MKPEDIDRREVLRYLGYKRKDPDEAVSRLIEECITALCLRITPRHIERVFVLQFYEENGIDAECFRIESRNLAKNLKDCEQILIFAATLGIGADQLIQRYNRLEMSRAVVLQAAAAAMIETYCDEICGLWKKQWEEQGWYARPRFSPGYGDFPLSCNASILDCLEAGKRIGIKLTDSLLMMPSKSVTAVIGLSRKPYRCDIRGCEVCAKTDCAYRR